MPEKTKILMVDDDKMLIDLYKERLELAGYQVDISRDGEEGLAKIHQVKPDLVLLDIMMPKVNGYEALASIKSDPTTKDIPVIILSALMRDINKSKAIESGADDYIIKSEAMPVDVIKKIEGVLQKYHKNAPTPEPPTPEPPVPEPPTLEPEPLQVAPPSAESPAPNPNPESQPPAQINFEPAAGGQDLAPSPNASPAEANFPPAQAVPPTVSAPALSSQNIPQVSEKTSPLVVFFLILIVILILASDVFFWMRLITGK